MSGVTMVFCPTYHNFSFIDNSNDYQNYIDPNYRSLMNISFQLTSKPNLTQIFLKEAEQYGLYNLPT